MQQVVSRFNATLNDHNENQQTQLYHVTCLSDVESVRFFLLQGGILINKFSRFVTRRQGAADIIHWRTPLNRAEQRVTLAAINGSLSDDEVSRRNQVAVLLRDAGVHA